MDTPSCVSMRSSHLQVISSGALKQWTLWSLDIKNALLQADSSRRGVYLHAPPEWCPKNPNRVWKLNTPTYGLSDAPAAFRRPLKRYLLKNEASFQAVGLKYEVSNQDPCLYMVFNREGEAVGVFSSHVDDILGRGVPGVLERARYFSGQRFGALKTRRAFSETGVLY